MAHKKKDKKREKGAIVMIVSKTFTIETRLEKTKEVEAYFSSYLKEYNAMYREMWHKMIAPDYRVRYPKDSYFVTEMCQTYGVLKRTINSIRYDIKGRIRALLELKKIEQQALEIKIEKKEEKVQVLQQTIERRKPKVRENQASPLELKQYREEKSSLYYQKNQLNRMKQSLQQLKYEIEHQKLSLGFGGKQMFQKQYHLEENGYQTHAEWYRDYIQQRDKNIFYLGSSDETQGNQLVQLKYREESNDFTIQVRKEKKYSGEKKEEQYLRLEQLQFAHLREEFIEVLKHHEKKSKGERNPISYRIRKEGKKWYLQAMFAIEVESYETSSRYGVIGLDYNDGFIEVAETDACGNLVGQQHYELRYHGTGTKAKTEIEQVIAKIVAYSKRTGKDISIEALDFKKTKARTGKAKGTRGKQYQRMLHLFDYSRYQKTLEYSTHRQKVRLHKVTPYYTSRIGKEKYSEQKKLNVHQAASYVIARKGQGFCDKLKKAEKK